MKPSQIKNTFIKHIKETPTKIEDKSEGYDHDVKIITTKNNKYVFKTPKREPLLIKNQVFASKSWLKAGVPVPKILYHDDSLLIEPFIEGTQLEKLRASKKQKQKIYFQLGKLMKKMHSLKTKGYGPFEGGKSGRYRTINQYKEWMKNKINKSQKLIKNKKLLSIQEQESLQEYLNKNLKLLSKVKPALCHSDLCEEHVYVKDNKITGIIDLADIKSDDPMSDFRRISKFNNDYFNYVVKGYGKVNEKRIKLHRVLLILYQLPKIIKLKKHKRLKLFIGKLKKYLKEDELK